MPGRYIELRQVRAPTPSLECTEADEIPSLVCIAAVCCKGPEVLRLPHIVTKLHEFLDWSPRWSFTNACKANLLFLAQRIISKLNLLPLNSALRFSGFRQWQFTEGMTSAIATGDLQLVKLLSTSFQGCNVSAIVVEEAAKHGRMEILQWLLQNRSDLRWTDREVELAIRGGHWELAKWMKGKICTTSLEMLELWAATAAGEGNAAMLEWICSLSTRVKPRGAVFEAVDNGHLDVVKWIMSQPERGVSEVPEALEQQIDLNQATNGGYYEVLEWLLRFYPEKCLNNGADIEAARIGRLDIVMLFYENGGECHPRQAFNFAAAGGHLDVVKWLYNHNKEDVRPGQAIDRAASSGFLDVVEWLHSTTFETCSTFAMDGAAENGHFEVVKWLHKHRREGCTSTTMDSAAEQGNLEMVKWLTVNRKESCSPEAMNLAAANGHLGVVKWLHANRHEGCTVDAMDKAAANGHLSTVQWLSENRTEGCTERAMDLAATHGHLHIVKWLHKHRREGCTVRAMNEAARCNQLEVVQWLDANRTEGCTTRALDAAAERGHVEMVQWLDTHRHVGYSAAAIDTAVACGHFDVAIWIRQRHSEYNIVRALRRSPYINRRWQFIEWACLHDPVGFELEIAQHLLVD